MQQSDKSSAANRYKRQAEDARRAIDARIAPRATPPAPVKSAATTAVQWECQVGAADKEGSLAIFDVTITTPDVREAIRRCCEDYPSEDIEWIKVRRV